MPDKQAMILLESREIETDIENENINTALLPLYLNLSLTELRLDSPQKALKYGNKALKIDPTNTKALFRCGQVSVNLYIFVKQIRLFPDQFCWSFFTCPPFV